MSTRHSQHQTRIPRNLPRGRWTDDDFDGFDDVDELEELEELDDELDPGGVDRRPARRPARGAKAVKPKKSDRRKGRAAEAVDEDEALEDELDPEISELLERKERERRKVHISESFKCRHCKQFIGAPPSGGSQRNHCPMCLYSLHVDGKTPGDRLSDCRSLMEPVGTFYRANGEQVVVHRCLGCGFVRYNRIAADDNPVLLRRLPIVDPPAQTEWEG